MPLSTAEPWSAECGKTNWKLVLSYDGTDYRGWQVQPGKSTIQGELAAAIERVTGERVLPQGSGRTDAGVHALGQVASFALRARIPAANLMRALNRTLAPEIRILSAHVAASNFHARHSASGKSYEYRVLVCDPFSGTVCPPSLARFVYAVETLPEIGAMQEAAKLVVGEHDFTSFAAFDPDRTQRSVENSATECSNLRVIRSSTWSSSTQDGLTLLIYRVTGNGFLHHMVRNLVGTFLEVGWRSRVAEDIPKILQAHDRSAAGRTAPARGLFLFEVEYE